MLKSLSGRFLILTTVLVLLAEVMILVPALTGFRVDYLMLRLERAQIASLALLADVDVPDKVQTELLENAEVFNVVLRRNDVRQLVLSSPVPGPVNATYDLRTASQPELVRDALVSLFNNQNSIIRVIGYPVRDAGQMIEITMESGPLRAAMVDYGLQLLVISAALSAVTAMLLLVAVRGLLLQPIQQLVGNMRDYASDPEDARRIIIPGQGVTELREAEEALRDVQTQLTSLLRQKDRLAQLGSAVAKISHDLRNILTSAQLFTDRLETSKDPAVQRLAPKLVGSITRAVNLCETTLAFGRAEEPPPRLSRFALAVAVAEVIDAERLAAGEHDISFAEDVPGDMVLLADSEQLYRVISNLVRNARQAIVTSEKPGEIGISAQEDADCWWITVRDTGPGLPAKARQHLFQAFQGGVSKGGAGLGLTISAELIRGHGGRLELLETSDAGTTFRIALPKHRTEDIPVPAVTEQEEA
ncbi:sensor histidine kinase [Ketogulonicigenium vulgare]|nr:HAMP domain-containing sensor histidine kinase [Ketogulonicigenium vulgare]ADO43626.1 periplasmic sensor signal transduction histidine kinase [Ketogulonicigenium vulgare Y25]ALJ81998.1 ATPase [Ketogulonicigenium vulgare]ANW34636.1 ATPase [Ketogulonicigenium vulgare]AOZ55657.1 periplasmic sensor signal transduction histidine kinase [Ketogulonicigenium vulgare]